MDTLTRPPLALIAEGIIHDEPLPHPVPVARDLVLVGSIRYWRQAQRLVVDFQGYDPAEGVDEHRRRGRAYLGIRPDLSIDVTTSPTYPAILSAVLQARHPA